MFECQHYWKNNEWKTPKIKVKTFIGWKKIAMKQKILSIRRGPLIFPQRTQLLISRQANLAFKDFMYISSISLSFFKVEPIVFNVLNSNFLSFMESSYFFKDNDILSIAFSLLDYRLKTY